MDKSKLLEFWYIDYKESQPKLNICGSPERCLHREVIIDSKGDYYVLEMLEDKQVPRKAIIAKNLVKLKENGLKRISPYLKSKNNKFMVQEGNFWQLRPYVLGTPLDRPKYAFEKWRGEKLVEFIIELRNASQDFVKEKPFSIIDYMYDFQLRILNNNPELNKPVNKLIKYLENSEFVKNHDDIPLHFCHGDIHPINCIWDKDDIKAVIDWEFCGTKPELYDPSLLIGCLGFEEPDSLVNDCVLSIVKGLKKEMDLKYLFDFILATRFGWLSEWLRKDLPDMQKLELQYWDILIEKRKVIENLWFN